MKKEKIRVALVCCFSNTKVRDHLLLDNRKLYNLARKLLGLPSRNGKLYGDVAGWDTYMIELLGKRDDIELYVISAHSGLKRYVESFVLEDVQYNFVRIEESSLLKRLIPSPYIWHKLNPMRPVVRSIIKRINPDVIALIGAENAQISGTVLGNKNIPLFVVCQTIYNNPERKHYAKVNTKDAYVERLIFKDLKYVSVTTDMHERLFRTMNKQAINFNWEFGNLLPEVKSQTPIFDFVNFAMGMSSKKGFPDAIKALAIVKKIYPQIKLNLIGNVTEEQKTALRALVTSLGLVDNVVFTPFFEKQEDLFQHLQFSRFALLPCKIDYIASTVRQAMHYGLPVVCYETEGTVTLNNEKPCVMLAENSNIEDLADKMLMLLGNSELVMGLRKNPKEYSSIWSNDAENSQLMFDNFRAIIMNYNEGVPVPKELLYVPNNR